MSCAGDQGRAGAVAASVAAGVIVGALCRNVPEALAMTFLRPPPARPCGMEEVLECTLRSLPDVFGELMILALVVVAIDAVLALAGVGLAVIGGVRLRRGPEGPGREWPGLGLLGLGVAFLVPASWLLGSFVWFLLGGGSG